MAVAAIVQNFHSPGPEMSGCASGCQTGLKRQQLLRYCIEAAASAAVEMDCLLDSDLANIVLAAAHHIPPMHIVLVELTALQELLLLGTAAY